METLDFTRYLAQTRERVAASCQMNQGIDPLLGELQRAAFEAEQAIASHSGGDLSFIDCGPGCCSCCIVNVSILLPEGIAICRYIRQQSPELEQRVSERLEALWQNVRGLDDEDRLFVRGTCGFLDEQGSCIIYPVRPLLCRSLSSTDANRCRDALAGKFFGDESTIEMHQFQQKVYETLFVGVAEGLQEYGVDDRSFQLTGLVRYLLRKSQAESEWLSGRRLSWQDIY